MHGYELIDSGGGRKLERFGKYVLSRPCSQALWEPQHKKAWKRADAVFTRDEKGHWEFTTKLPESWVVDIDGMKMRVQLTDFGHVGLFAEQRMFWKRMREIIRPGQRVLNLFAYSGGSTLCCAQKGASLCHLDASKGMVDWARQNAALNGLEKAPIRWIVEDAMKFLQREQRRGSFYDAIILDPPSFGRGSKGEVFKIERDIQKLLGLCRDCLSSAPSFVLFSCHTPGFTPLTVSHLLEDAMPKGEIEFGEMCLEAERVVPSGVYAFWRPL